MKTQCRRRGMFLVYAAVMMVVFLAFVSLSVDLGRVQVAKTQLRQAADAAGRYAATGLSDSTYLAKAQAAASENNCDGTAVALTSADIEPGTWGNGMFVSGGSPANAIRITARRIASRNTGFPLLFARFVGRSTIDISAVSICTYTTGGGGNGLVGLNRTTINTSGIVDSYLSSDGTYSAAIKRANGDIATNGTLSFGGGVQVNGDATYKLGYSTVSGSGVVAPGTVSSTTSTLTYANPTVPGGASNMGAYSGTASGSLYLAAGNYYFSSLSVTGSYDIQSNGQINIYVGGPMTISGSFTAPSNLPSNLRFFTTAATTINLNNTTMFADIYAPNSTVNITGNSTIYGRVVAGTLSVGGSTSVHYDESLNTTGVSSGAVTMVK